MSVKDGGLPPDSVVQTVDPVSYTHLKILSFTFYDGPRHFMTNKPINTPEDLKGMRIRTIGQEVCTETIQAMGIDTQFQIVTYDNRKQYPLFTAPLPDKFMRNTTG